VDEDFKISYLPGFSPPMLDYIEAGRTLSFPTQMTKEAFVVTFPPVLNKSPKLYEMSEDEEKKIFDRIYKFLSKRKRYAFFGSYYKVEFRKHKPS
jgi:hypothetical protein